MEFGPPRLIDQPCYGGPGNGELTLTPATAAAERVLEFHFPGLSVGTAEYPQGPTGVTVFAFDRAVRTWVDSRGGAVGLYGGYDTNHAICFAGGSLYGHGAGAGVNAELLRRNGNRTAFDDLQLVSTAVIYDLAARPNAVVPDAALGLAALNAAREGLFGQGRVGAGVSATAGKIDSSRTEFAGQGAAFAQIGGIRILVAVVANPIGVIVDRDGTVRRGNYDAATGRRRHPDEDFSAAFAEGAVLPVMGGNTTLTLVATNARLSEAGLGQFARQVHDSMARAIQPFHTEDDGDVLFAVTTDEIDLPTADSPVGRKANGTIALGALAGGLAWDAVLECAR